MNADKCIFFTDHEEYIGHTLTSQGIKHDAEKVCAIVDMPSMNDKKSVKYPLGTVNYLAKFVLNMLTVTQPIQQLLQRDVEFQ